MKNMGENLTLLVDDDSICNSISKILLKRKFAEESEIISFLSPVEGLSYLKQVIDEEKYKSILVLLDINMPVMTGWEFLEEYARFPKSKTHVHIFVLTSSVSQTDIEKATKNPHVREFISKPITAATVNKLYANVA
jgi:CheY-like chemotaxis protein